MGLVSLEFVKAALRVSHVYDDAVLSGYIEAASDRVIQFLKDAADEGWTEDTAPPIVRIAVTIAVDAIYTPGKAEILSGLSTNDPRNPIVAMLHTLRVPTVV